MDFLIKYLGLQLALRPLSKAEWQPMLDMAVNLVTPWMKSLIARVGRLILVKSVLSARHVHHLLVANAPVWLLQEIEKNMRAFLWQGRRK